MTTQLKINFTLFALGLLGIIAMAISPVPIELPSEILEKYSKATLSILLTIQPIILLALAIFIGNKLTPKVGLSAPTVEGIIKGKFNRRLFKSQFISGSGLGLIAGVTLALVSVACTPYLPQEMVDLNESANISPMVRFLYGGITEEILVRWGFMTLFIWISWKVFNKKSPKPSPSMYWAGIVLAALLFGIGHLPAVYSMVDNVTPFLVWYIIIPNMAFGLVTGWLFWKKGIEAAIIAHIFAHIGMMLIERFMA